MKKVLVFLFSILVVIFLSVVLILLRPIHREKEAQESTLPFSEEILLPFHTFQWKLPLLDLRVQKTVLTPNRQEKNRKKKSVWQYISVGRCGTNSLSPAYLDQKMQKNTSDKKTLPMGSVDCGLIRTNIPFSF